MKAQMFNHSEWILETDPNRLKDYFDRVLVESGFTIVDFCEKHFEPFGYTSLYLLSESHFAVHTFPEEGKSYIEISSCINQPYEQLISVLKDRL